MAEKVRRRRAVEPMDLRCTMLGNAAGCEPPSLLAAVLERAVRLLAADGGLLYLCDLGADGPKCVVNCTVSDEGSGVVRPNPDDVAATVVRSREVVVIDRFGDRDGKPDTLEAELQKTVLAVPIIWRDQVTGVIELVGLGKDVGIGDADVELLVSFADCAATTIEHARLSAQAQQQIAERRRAEEEITDLLRIIERAKQEWESTADSLPDLICLLDGKGRIIRANRTVETWGLASVSGVRGRWFHQLLHPACGQESCYLNTFWARAWERARRGEPDQCDAYDEVLGRHVLVRVQPYEAEGERAATGCTVVTVRDITQQKQAEMENVRLLLETDRLRAFNESIVQGVAEAILMEDAEGVLTFANQAAEELLGYRREELVGLGWWTIVAEEEREAVRRETAKRSQGLDGSYETALLARSGEVVPVICSARPLFEDENLVGVLSAFTDMRDYKRIEEYMRGQDRLAAVGQLAAGIAHDFNNILTSIIGFAQLAAMRADVPPAVKADLEPIVAAGHRAAHLIRQILDFSRTSLTQQQPLALSPFLEEMVRFLQRTIPEDVEMIMDVGPDDYLVNADPVQLHQALANLALNARDAMPDGGELRFRLARMHLADDDVKPFPNMRPGRWVALSVSDTGTGIPADVLPRIYEPFFTTKEVGEGTGLGLSQVYGIVRQHGGFIEVETEQGIGTTFTIYLAALDLRAAGELGEKDGATEPLRGNGETILVVEDEQWALAATRGILEHLGYRVLAATDGFHALSLYERHTEGIDLVLADMVMPGMDGQELFRALKELDPDIRVVLMTGYPLEARGRKLLEQGIVTWLQKPVDIERLAEVVTRSLREEGPFSPPE